MIIAGTGGEIGNCIAYATKHKKLIINLWNQFEMLRNGVNP